MSLTKDKLISLVIREMATDLGLALDAGDEAAIARDILGYANDRLREATLAEAGRRLTGSRRSTIIQEPEQWT